MSEPRFGIENLEGLWNKALSGALGYGPKLSVEDTMLVIDAINALSYADEGLKKLLEINEIIHREFNTGQRCSVCVRTDGGDDCTFNC